MTRLSNEEFRQRFALNLSDQELNLMRAAAISPTLRAKQGRARCTCKPDKDNAGGAAFTIAPAHGKQVTARHIPLHELTGDPQHLRWAQS